MTQRVLLADDDWIILDMYRTALANAGFEVTAVGGGEKAITEMARALPDVVVLDIQMPKVDGLEVLRWMRTIATIDVPVVILTNSAGDERRQEAERLGLAAWLMKSQTLPRQLIQILQAIASSMLASL